MPTPIAKTRLGPPKLWRDAKRIIVWLERGSLDLQALVPILPLLCHRAEGVGVGVGRLLETEAKGLHLSLARSRGEMTVFKEEVSVAFADSEKRGGCRRLVS